MKVLVVGAGATLAEALNLGNAPLDCPPLIRNFARKTWKNFSPVHFLIPYLYDLGQLNPNDDPRERFFELEASGETNVEAFFEYAWNNRHVAGARFREIVGSTFCPAEADTTIWNNFVYHGVAGPIWFDQVQCFHRNGVGWLQLPLAKSIGMRLTPGDVVLNLNYDTVFEMGLKQAGRSFKYSPHSPASGDVLVAKPHGSLNLAATREGFLFGDCDGQPLAAAGFQMFAGLMPPRSSKSFSQNEVSAAILRPILEARPSELLMWGVGLTQSDVDLIELYERWASHAVKVEVINPSQEVAEMAARLLNKNVIHHRELSGWLTG